eukprot:m.29055 g.29055  ORF g.29055 m.29055 type:complete len:683 (+) comp8059_c1_seq1:44-2092(+)
MATSTGRMGLDGKENKVPLDQRPKHTVALQDIPQEQFAFLKSSHNIQPGSDTLWHLSEARYLLKTKLQCNDGELHAAALFHSIYGPLTRFTGNTLVVCDEERQRVRDVIGRRAELTAYAHCVMSRSSFDDAVKRYIQDGGKDTVFKIEVRQDAPAPLELTSSQLRDLMTVHFADWMQQLEPYDFWGYRREAYTTMATALGGVFKRAHEHMMTVQPEKYRDAVIKEMHRGQGGNPINQAETKKMWNWAETYSEDASKFVWPETVEDVVKIVSNAKKLRVAGTRHSCAPLIACDEMVLCTEKLNKIKIDPERRVATVQAGVTCVKLCEAATPYGLALPTLGTIDWQTISGAVMTGTHGGALGIPSLHAFVRSYTIVKADGSIVKVDREREPQLFSAMAPSMGVFGVTVEMEVDMVPAQYLEAKMQIIPWDEVPKRFKTLSESNKYLRVVIYPGLQKATIWTANPVRKGSAVATGATGTSTYMNFRSTEEKEMLVKWLQFEESGLKSAQQEADALLGKVLQSQSKRLQRYEGLYNHVLCLERNHGIPHADMELGFDYQNCEQILTAAIDHFRTHRAPYYNFEIRCTKQDPAMLSCCNERDTLWIDFQAKAGVCRDYFTSLEHVFAPFGYRKHWAKGLDHTQAGYIAKNFPKLPQFLSLLREWDPKAKFQNEHIARFTSQYTTSKL